MADEEKPAHLMSDEEIEAQGKEVEDTVTRLRGTGSRADATAADLLEAQQRRVARLTKGLRTIRRVAAEKGIHLDEEGHA